MLESQGYPTQKGALAAVSRHLGVPGRTLTRWFNKEQNPPPDQLVREKRGDFIEKCDSIIDLLFTEIESAIPGAPLNQLSVTFGIVTDKRNFALENGKVSSSEARTLTIPADLLASTFIDVWRDVRDHKHTEYVLYGGRGSTKSSFISLALICQLVNNPTVHGLATRQVANTLRDSVYAQLRWAIGELNVYYPGLSDDFKCTTSPLEIEYKPTGQKIYFRGADDPGKIKSIKPASGYIALLWMEELDQFAGPESVRKIEQSVLRGGDIAFIFKSFNPPRTASNWANKYTKVPKPNQLQHSSDYLKVPVEWLGKPWLDEAEHLKDVNPLAYDHEYLGLITGTGGMVFPNVLTRAIPDDEIAQFDHLYQGLDWGYALDPLHWVKLHYDAKREIIYVFDEYRAHQMSNARLFEVLTTEKGWDKESLIIADSAEPKSIGDFRSYDANVRGAEKPPESVRYSMRWLENRAQIVIDPARCPYTADEFLSYEYEQTKDGEWISEYPDKNNHAIDSVRYATNLVWRRRGS